jgi:threonine synthase
MGLPVKKLICASNSNNVLTDFLSTGVYSRNRKFYPTISPSMDILVSSNLERLLFDLTGGDGEKVSGWMRQLSESGEYRVDGPVLSAIRELFYAGFCGDGDTRKEIGRVFQAEHYLCDPHTAVASAVAGAYRKETGDETPMLVVSTASPYKFSSDVLEALTGSGTAVGDEFSSVEALSSLTGTAVPGPISALREKPTRFKSVCKKDEMGAAVLKFSRREMI